MKFSLLSILLLSGIAIFDLSSAQTVPTNILFPNEFATIHKANLEFDHLAELASTVKLKFGTK